MSRNYKGIDIILPVYHEEGNIEKVLLSIQKKVKYPHIVSLVFQDKKDPTIAIARKLTKKYKHRIIFTKDGIGIVKAIKEGIKSTKSAIIVVMMSDRSDDPQTINEMVKKLSEGYDLVSACRYGSNGQRRGGPIIKGMLSYLACKSLRFFTGIPTNDATNAFKCFRRSFISTITMESIYGYELPLEITVKAFKQKRKIADVPTIWNDRKSGKSKFDLLQILPHYLRWYLFAFQK